MSSLKFPHLLSFGLVTEDRFKGPCTSDMISFLRGHPTLEVLRLNQAEYSYADDADTHIEPVTLQHLTFTRLGGTPTPPSPDSHPHIEVDLLPYLFFPPLGQCNIWISLVNVVFPSGTSYLLTLIRAWEIISSPGGSFGAGSGFTQAKFSTEESPSTLTGQVELWIAKWGSLSIGPKNMVIGSWSWLTPDWGQQPQTKIQGLERPETMNSRHNSRSLAVTSTLSDGAPRC